jgi:outer membrane protein
MLEKDNVKNDEIQLESTQEQLRYAEARKEAGSLNLSDFLNIKSQLATDKTNLVQSKNSYQMALVSLMQLMNMPVNSEFDIVYISVDDLISSAVEFDAVTVYNIALGLQPSIKSAQLNIESAEADIKIARADALPELTLDGSIGSGYVSDYYDIGFDDQFSNNIYPSIGLNLTIPIFQQKEVKTQVRIAKIGVENSKLELMDQQNSLRKYIEQACTDALLARSNYEALQEQFLAEQESYQVVAEMFKQGMINSVDLLTSKNNLVVAENQLIQAKYTLVLQNEIVEYYMGNKIAL